MWKWISIVLLVIVLAFAGLYGYWYFFVYPQQKQLAQAYGQFHQAAETATTQTQKMLDEAQYGGNTVGATRASNPNPPVVSNPAKQPTTQPIKAGSTVTISDLKHLAQISVPAAWAAEPNTAGGFVTYYEHPVVQGQASPALVSIFSQPPGGAHSCSENIATSVAADEKQTTNFQKKIDAIPGAQEAIQDSGIYTITGRYQVRLYVCANGFTIAVAGDNLGSLQNPNPAALNAANAAIASFKVLSQ